LDGARRDRSRAMVGERVTLEASAVPATPEHALDRAQIVRSVQAAVSALPATFRLAILLRYFEDLSYREMAKALNCSMGTVASRLSRAHRMLADKLSALRGAVKGQ